MQLEDYNYNLPAELIAQAPIEPRDNSKLLSLNNFTFNDLNFSFFPKLFNSGDVIVINDTKVIKALLIGELNKSKVSFNLNFKNKDSFWFAFCKPSKKCKEGEKVYFKNKLEAKIIKNFGNGEVLLDFNYEGIKLIDKLSEVGEIPLPPYIKIKSFKDEDNYQTFFAKNHGAVASPTAGLHFTENIVNTLKENNIIITPITLHVGSGTFLPIRTNNIINHKMHFENFEIPLKTSELINQAKLRKNKIICIGTTVARTLESVALNEGTIKPMKGKTNLFIKPGFNFKIMDYLLTNFHLPKSTLLVLISSFFGYENVMKMYKYAIKKKYRFYSYGDCCLLPKNVKNEKI